MKKFTLISILLLAVLVPLFSQAAGYFTELSPSVIVGTKYTANYKVTSVPSNPNTTIKVYGWFSEQGSGVWNYNIENTSLIDISSTSLNQTFTADFPFNTFNIVAGKKYVYYLADKGDASGAYLTAPACFTVSGPSSCTALPTNPVLTTTSFGVAPSGNQLADTTHPGNYKQVLAIKPSFNVVTPINATLKIYKELNGGPQYFKEDPVVIPTGSASTFPTVDDLPVGQYSAKLFSGTTEISADAGWRITSPAAGFTFSGNPTVTCTAATSSCDFKININVTSAGTLKMHVRGFPKHVFDSQPKVNGSVIDDSSSGAFAIGAQQVSVGVPYSDITTYANSVADTQFWYSFHEQLNNKDSNIGDLFDTAIQGISTTVGAGTPPLVTSGNNNGVDFNNANSNNGASGACGAAHQGVYPVLTAESANLCSSGVVQQFNYSGTAWTWNCVGTSGVPTGCNATGEEDTNYGSNFLKNPLGAGLDTFPKIILTVYNNIVLPIAIPVIVLAIMYAGFKFVMARKTGTVDGYADAKRVLKYTLIGTALVLGGWVIANALQGTLNSLVGTVNPTALLMKIIPWA